jgi:phytoene dehydrogenase-like protein
VNHVIGGIGNIAKTLADWIKANGGTVRYRQEVERVVIKNGRVTAVHTNKGLTVEGDAFLANVTPWALVRLLGENEVPRWQKRIERTEPTWGAFTLYLGLDDAELPAGTADHHQVVVDPLRPLGEGNSVFISLSDADDLARVPQAGLRAATLSTHTAVAPWHHLQNSDRAAYEARRQAYAERLLEAAERALPGIRRAVRLYLPGTPVTFQRFTKRPLGMVGGFAQESLLRAVGPATGIANLWLVGDSIFPGQSTAGVTVGGKRVAAALMQQVGPA